MCAIWNKDWQDWIPQLGKELEKHVPTAFAVEMFAEMTLADSIPSYANAPSCGSVHLPSIPSFSSLVRLPNCSATFFVLTYAA